MSVIINWIAVVLYVFQTQTVSKKSQLLCIQQLRGTDSKVYSFFPFLHPLFSPRHSLSSPTCPLLSIALFVSQTFLWRQSFIWDHWTFLLIFLCQHCPLPTEPHHLRFTSGHTVVNCWNWYLMQSRFFTSISVMLSEWRGTCLQLTQGCISIILKPVSSHYPCQLS